ncbi:hypothetical protein BU24DRAFT_116058 [Aaosphaeria arxii CBS 175.79]|uniref:Uncharacterized protein n=1 Tax=Aaosphaeria arxii CBS 175.79 TaxID=1450172 RepID=A0A6A5Y1D2_9PLEO|nr:uncharacterized protein BU24DRAFT_116058 [Aaosphaeria arxii CBS 175.79]KAF2019288.1 hypothetical protein BU24DRAFT_116058 [Aaosphaeria arxii CBS 175.79]
MGLSVFLFAEQQSGPVLYMMEGGRTTVNVLKKEVRGKGGREGRLYYKRRFRTMIPFHSISSRRADKTHRHEVTMMYMLLMYGVEHWEGKRVGVVDVSKLAHILCFLVKWVAFLLVLIGFIEISFTLFHVVTLQT